MVKKAYIWFLHSIGIISLVIGIVALAIPLVPTVPFLLISAYCFSKSSPRFRHWLINHKHLGPGILEWEQHQVIRPKQKAIAVISLCISLCLPIFFMDLPDWGKWGSGLTGAAVILFILTRNSKIPCSDN